MISAREGSGSLELLAVAGIVSIGCVVVVLLRETNRAWAVPQWSVYPSPRLGPMPPPGDGRRPA